MFYLLFFFQKEALDYEHSELLLYQNMVIVDSGDIEGALRHLDKHEHQIFDRLAVEETYGELYLRLSNKQAIPYYMSLIKRNPENTNYYKKLIQAKGITEPSDIVEMYLDFEKQFPKAMPPRRLPLNYASGEQFRQLVDRYLRRGLHKGVPPLFVDLRSLYSDPEKVKSIEQLLIQYVDSLKKSGRFSEEDERNGAEPEPASALLWTYYYLAQHFDHLRDTDKALEFVDAAIEHTPTLIELFVVKVSIWFLLILCLSEISRKRNKR